jgi:hypothetical protein
MAKLLGDGDLADEARRSLLDAALALGCLHAIQSRMPEPASLEDALTPPLSHAWKEALQPLRAFVADSAAPWKPFWDTLQKR